MTVKEVFDLRKQGKIEEAYEAIRPMYAVHQGKYTTLCMFWTASDILKKRIEANSIQEAENIFKALLRVQPNIEDKDGKAQTAMMHHALRLSEVSASFRMLDFVESLPVEALTDADWQGGMSQDGKHPLPSTVQRLLTRAFHEIQVQMYGDFITKKAPSSHDEVVASKLIARDADKRSASDDSWLQATGKNLRSERQVAAGIRARAQRDAMPVVRMQAEMRNLGYAVGVAAARCAEKGIAPRQLDVKELQKQLT